MKKIILTLLLVLGTLPVLAQDAVKVAKDAGLESEAQKSGVSIEEGIQRAKGSGYTDQEILNAIEQKKKNGNQSYEPTKEYLSWTKAASTGYLPFEDEIIFSNKDELMKLAKQDIFAANPFGYNIFQNVPQTFEPLDFGPVDPNYLVGPGDEIIINLWGQVQVIYTAVVDREGKISIPDVGLVILNGYTLNDARIKISDRLARVYSGIKNRSISVDISLGKLKKIKVFVLGEAQKPGGYVLNSMTTVFNALYYAGGPTRKGSLRMVKLIRNNQVIATLDLYQLLLKGQNTSEIRLQSEDVIFIPLIKKRVALPKGVCRPGIYELIEGEGLKTVLSLAGGLRPDAYTDIIHVNRTGADGTAKIIDVRYGEIVQSENDFALFNEDVIGMYKVPENIDNFITIDGSVLIPGLYELAGGMTVRDLINRAGGVLQSAYKFRIEISRILFYSRPESTLTFSIDLDAAETDSFLLKPRDIVFIKQDPDWELQRNVTIEGKVTFPGKYSLHSTNERMTSLIKRAGDLKTTAYPEGLIFVREGVGQIDVDLKRALQNKGKLDDILLKDGDYLYIPEKPASIAVRGEVLFPISTLHEPGKSVGYYLEKVGGLTEDADKGKITLRLANGRNVKPKKFLWTFNLTKVPPGATIVVPKKKETEGIKWGDVIQNTTAIVSATAVMILAIKQIN
jgi:protein involved in polysaccharide export with SLBB domain